MSEETLRLLAEERALEEQLSALRTSRREAEQEEAREKLEAEQLAELSKPVEISITRLSGGSLLFEGGTRSDVLKIFQSTQGRKFQGYTNYHTKNVGKNLIPITEHEKLLGRLGELEHVTVKWADGVQKELEWFVNAPPWEVTTHFSGRHFIAKPGPMINTRTLHALPGAEFDEHFKHWKLPLTEGWRIFDSLASIEGVVYTEEAKEIIFEQVKSRSRLNEIAQQEETDFITELRGNELRPFQAVGIEFIHAAGGRVMLCDATGLGKTWQSLGYAEVMRGTYQAIRDDEDDPYVKPQTFQTICVIKAANLPNWIREIKRLTGEDALHLDSGMPEYFQIQALTEKRVPYVVITYDVLAAYTKKREMVECVQEAYANFEKIEDWDHKDCMACDGTKELEGAEVLTYTWQGILTAAKPDLFILDEAHQIKNPDTHRFKALKPYAEVIPHIIPMTASPVLNRTEELWPLLYMLDPGMFKVQAQFLRDYTYGGRHTRNAAELHELLRPRFLRRLKKDVQKDLPPINRIYNYRKLSAGSEERYKEVLAGIYKELDTFNPSGFGGQRINIMSMLAQITRLKQVCAADMVEHTAELATNLIDEDENGGKVLIFTHFKGTCAAIAQKLGGQAVCTVRRTTDDFVSMDATKRDALFEAARHDPYVKYLVTTEAAKEGHNIEFCNWTIFNDLFWTPAAHDQCEGRSYGRLSDPHPIDSHYMISDVDIVKWIMELLKIKIGIIETAVEGVEGSREEDGASLAAALISRMQEEMF